MSFWSDLCAGDAKRIAAAFNEAEAFDGNPFVLAHVNLPGIVPDASGELANTPNLLTDLACSAVGIEPAFTFADSIAEHLSGDPDPTEATDGVYGSEMDRALRRHHRIPSSGSRGSLAKGTGSGCGRVPRASL